MKYKITKIIGMKEHEFTVEGDNLFECQMEAQKLSFPDVTKCGLCSDDDLRFYAYITKKDKFKYIKIICNACGGSIQFGQTTDDPNTFYLRKTKDKKYDWQEKPTENKTKPEAEGNEPMSPEQDEYIKILRDSMEIDDATKTRLNGFLAGLHTVAEGEKTIKVLQDIITEKGGIVPDRGLPF